MKAGSGEAYLLAVAWRHSGADPYRMFHMLESDYRPVGRPEAPPLPPAYPGRVKTFMYACALFAEEEEVERVKAMMGATTARRMGAT